MWIEKVECNLTIEIKYVLPVFCDGNASVGIDYGMKIASGQLDGPSLMHAHPLNVYKTQSINV